MELTGHDALAAHAEAELGISSDEQTNPWHAALASAIAFTVGAIIPLLAIMLSPAHLRVQLPGLSVALGLAITEATSAHLGGAGKLRPVVRNVLMGCLAMALTFAVSKLVGGSAI